jgi:c-di-GMP-binding flagellar brake protein YcgR
MPPEKPETQKGPEAQKEPETDVELRSSPRLQCFGHAGIQTLPAYEKPFPAKIINLSLGGCLMALEMPPELVMDEIVELIFCVNHMPFHVRGKVRSIRSETLIGFQFPRLSNRSRTQLEDLIKEMIEHLAKLHEESTGNRAQRRRRRWS